MAIPTYVGKSTALGSASAGTIDFTGVGHQSGDWLIVTIASANEAIVTPTGFGEVPTVSPQFGGTAAAAGGIRLAVFVKTSDGTETTVSIADPGNHVYAVGIAVRPASGKFLKIDASAGKYTAASTSHSGNAITTIAADCLVVDLWGTDRDSAGPSYSAEANADLASLTERHDLGTTAGVGSGIVIYTGTKATAGSVAATTATSAASVAWCAITLALKEVTTGPFVGSATTTKVGASSGNTTVSLSGLFGGTRNAVLNGDLVVAVFATGSPVDRGTLSITDGTTDYTLIDSELFAAGDETRKGNLRVAYKFMGGTPDASVTFGPTLDADDAGAMSVFVFSERSQSTPLDVAAVPATGTGSVQPDPPSITPTTAGTVILVAGAAGATTGAVYTSSDLTDFVSVTQADQFDVNLGVGYKEWTSGAFNPAQFGGGGGETDCTWAAMSVALRLAGSEVTVGLTGQSLTSARGSVAGANALAVTGQTLTAAQGSVLAGQSITGQSLTAARGSVTTSASVALTGLSVSAARGSVAAQAAKALTGQAGTVGQGTVAPASSLVLTGGALAASQGSVSVASADVSAALTGQALVAAQGSVAGASAFALSGQGLVAAPGTTAASTATAIAGQSATVARGTTTADNALPITGQALAVQRGNVSAGGDVTIEIAGQSLTTAQGSVAPAFSLGITGQSVTAARGSLSGATSPTLSGLAVAMSAGFVLPVRSVGLSGLALAISQGSVTRASADVTLALTGQAVFAAAGSVLPAAEVEDDGLTVTGGPWGGPFTVTAPARGSGLTATGSAWHGNITVG